MSYTNVYPSRINWENEPSIASPINATNLNKIDYAVYEHDQTFETWDVTKANQSDLLLSVKSIDFDTDTGVFVFTWQNGTTKTVDLNIEKIPVSFSMSPQGVITMTTDDGTTYTADVGSLIKTYTFTDSSEIDFTVTTDSSGNKTITAGLVDGSITGQKLEPNYLANCQSAANSASGSATAADGSAEDSEAWAVGTRDGVPVPSTDPAYENNSKYWAEHTSNQLAGLSDVDISNVQDGDILAYNGSASKWKNGKPTAGGGSKIKITTSESTLYGEDVTLTQGTTTLTATFDSYGVAIFEGVTLTGNVQLTATDGQSTSTRTLTIPYFGNYEVTMAFFSATITVTFPYSLGASCTISDGTTTLTATTSPMAFNIPNVGTWTAKATLDGIEKNGTAKVITTDGQTESDTIEFGTIELTFDNEFRGQTITATDGISTITKTAPMTGNTMVLYPNATGNWTVSGVYSGVTYTTTAEVTSLSTPVSAILQTIPDGKTVTPTDNIQTWLHCAGINDKTSYTTLSDVLGDTTTLLALISDSNASDYLVRSTTWASGITADSTAMTDIGANNYCANTLLADSTWCAAICNSTYFESVLNVKVPTMTSNTTPSGVASCNSSQDAYYAFDNNSSSFVLPTSGSSATDYYIAYEFTADVRVCKMVLEACTSRSNDPVQDVYYDMILQGYDGSTWHDVSTNSVRVKYTSPSSGYSGHEFELIAPNSDEYIKYRMKCSSSNYPYAHEGGRYAISVGALQFYGREDV